MMNRNTGKPNPGLRFLLATAGVTAVIVPIAMGLFRLPSVRAQKPSGPVEFDAVSVKPADPNSIHGTVVDVTSGGTLRIHQCHSQRPDRNRIRRSGFSD